MARAEAAVIVASNFRPVSKNTLVGFVDLELTTIRLRLRDWTLHTKGESRWLSPPGRKFVGKDGQEVWTNMAEFTDTKAKASFQRQALEAIDKLIGSQPVAVSAKPASPARPTPIPPRGSPTDSGRPFDDEIPF